ncbi:MAG: DNA translocase FtsK [Chloroflexi bacterium]|nr:DNA translocase FtsK [Chloroflexota bacterium]
MRKRLEFQANRIETVLAFNKVPARVTGGTVTPRWVRFQVLPAVGAKISKIKNLSEEMAAALNASNCRVSRRGAAVAVEVPREDPKPVRFLPLFHRLDDQPANQRASQPPIPPTTAVLGLAEDGTPLLIRLSSPDVAHILVAGTTGSGKTMLLQTMILSLAMANSPAQHRGGDGGMSLVLIDPKGHAFRLFEDLPHLARPVIWKVEEMAEVLQSLVRLMEMRSGDGRTGRNGKMGRRPYTSAPVRPSVVVVIDELADLLMVGGKDVQRSLTRLTQRGREAGIHIVAATQKPTTAVLGPLVKANFPVRLVGRVTSVEDARTATGWSGTGAERLMGRGDFLAVAEGRVMRFQAAHVSPTEIRDVVIGLGNSNGWKVDRGTGEVLSAVPSLVSSRQMALPRPVDWLADVFRKGA